MPILLALLGPTASGKSDLAEKLAEQTNAQLLNADAFQVYRGLDIGTGKPADVPRYKLLDVADPWDQFGLGAWIRLASNELQDAWAACRSVIVVGGTGLYVRALFEGYASVDSQPDPALRAQLSEEAAKIGAQGMFERLQELAPEVSKKVDAANPRRVLRALERVLSPGTSVKIDLPPFDRHKFATNPPVAMLAERVERRVDSMLEAGWVEEVRRLIANPRVSIDSPGLKAIGYRFLWEHLQGSMKLEEARQKIIIATRQYAKRQRTWLRSEPGLEYLEWDKESAELSRRLRP